MTAQRLSRLGASLEQIPSRPNGHLIADARVAVMHRQKALLESTIRLQRKSGLDHSRPYKMYLLRLLTSDESLYVRHLEYLLLGWLTKPTKEGPLLHKPFLEDGLLYTKLRLQLCNVYRVLGDDTQRLPVVV